MLKRGDFPLEGREAVVLGPSNLVGKPMDHLFLGENAMVTVCHSRTKDLAGVAPAGTSSSSPSADERWSGPGT